MSELIDTDTKVYTKLWVGRLSILTEGDYMYELAEYDGKLSLFAIFAEEETRDIPPSFYDDPVYNRIDEVNELHLGAYPQLFRKIPKEYRERLKEQMALVAL